MGNSNQSTKHNATVVRPLDQPDAAEHPTVPGQSAANNSRPADETNWSLDTGQQRALTQIYHSLEASNNSVGFEIARQAANVALVDKKIILNHRFVLDSIIGSGGMGTVYKARDLRKIEANAADPHVAVKVLNEDFQNHPEAFVTLQREATKSQILAHPNIVSVHDFDRDGSVIYMTMGLLEGMDLEDHLKRFANNGLQQADAIEIIKAYCAALIYAHQKNIIHSDLKPSNIFLTKDGVKILDFGIARISSNSPKQDSFDAGSLGALTPAYASLEMLSREPPDQRDDVYAAAVIAYELLAGKHPFDQKDARRALAEDLKPARISNLNAQQWRALESGLKFRRSERTATVRQFVDELTHVRKNPWLKLAAIPLLLATAAMGYYGFSKLNGVSQGVDVTINKGLQCLEKKDFSCALENANIVLKLDPQNKDAKELSQLANVAYQKSQEKKIFETATACVESDKLDCARSNLALLKQTVPGSELANDLQKRIDLKIAHTTAARCFAEQNYTCANENSLLILEKDPANQFAMDMTRRIADIQVSAQSTAVDLNKKYIETLATAETCFGKKDFDCSARLARQALTYKPNEANAESLYQKSITGKKLLIETNYNEQVAGAETCFDKKDYDCSMRLTKQALAYKPNDPKADSLYQKATLASSQLIESNYTAHITSAETCFGNKDFDCSIQHAKQALFYKAADVKAETLAQKSVDAKNQHIELMNKAKDTLAQAQNCFKDKNYSCAVAKSDSALQLLPDMKEAVELKKSAQIEIDKQRPAFNDNY